MSSENTESHMLMICSDVGPLLIGGFGGLKTVGGRRRKDKMVR